MAWTTPRTFVTGEVETASIFNTHLRDNLDAGFPYGTTWQTYTPQLTASTTSPTLGSGSTQDGRYYRIGQSVFVHVTIQFGTSGTAAGSGVYYVSIPIAASGSLPGSSTLGAGYVVEDGTGNYLVSPRLESTPNTSRVEMALDNAVTVGATTPHAWGANDRIHLNLTYEAA